MAENGFAPLGTLADISYHEEDFKLRRIRVVCTLYAGALDSDRLLHICYHIKLRKTKIKLNLQKGGIKLSNYLRYSYSLYAGYLSYT